MLSNTLKDIAREDENDKKEGNDNVKREDDDEKTLEAIEEEKDVMNDNEVMEENIDTGRKWTNKNENNKNNENDDDKKENEKERMVMKIISQLFP